MDLSRVTLTSNTTCSLLNAALETLTCPVCSNVFTAPVSLPCGHSICRACADGICFRCCLCSKPFRTKQLIRNSVMDSIASDLRSMQSEVMGLARPPTALSDVGYISQEHLTPSTEDLVSMPPIICRSSTFTTEGLGTRIDRPVLECQDYVSVRNNLSYELSQGILERALKPEKTSPHYRREHDVSDSWTERLDLSDHHDDADTSDSHFSNEEPSSERKGTDSEVEETVGSGPAQTLTPEIVVHQFHTAPSNSVCPPKRIDFSDEGSDSRPLLPTEASNETEAQVLLPKYGRSNSVEPTASAFASSILTFVGTPMSPEVDISNNSKRADSNKDTLNPPTDENLFSSIYTGSDLEGNEEKMNFVSTSSKVAHAPALAATSHLIGTVNIGAKVDDSDNFADTLSPDSNHGVASSIEIGSLDPWGIQLRNELKEMKERLKRQRVDSSSAASQTCTAENITQNKNSKDNCGHHHITTENNAVSGFRGSPSPASNTTSLLAVGRDELTSAHVLKTSSLQDEPAIVCYVAASELTADSILKLQLCRDKGYFIYGDLSHFTESNSCGNIIYYNIFIVDCRYTQGSIRLCNRSVMYIKAICSGAYITDSSWLAAVIKNQCVVPPDAYEISGSEGDKVSGGPKRARTSRRNDLGQLFLFKNISFHLDLETNNEGRGQPVKLYKLSNDEIRWIIFFCGGKVISENETSNGSRRHVIRLVRSSVASVDNDEWSKSSTSDKHLTIRSDVAAAHALFHISDANNKCHKVLSSARHMINSFSEEKKPNCLTCGPLNTSICDYSMRLSDTAHNFACI